MADDRRRSSSEPAREVQRAGCAEIHAASSDRHTDARDPQLGGSGGRDRRRHGAERRGSPGKGGEPLGREKSEGTQASRLRREGQREISGISLLSRTELERHGERSSRSGGPREGRDRRTGREREPGEDDSHEKLEAERGPMRARGYLDEEVESASKGEVETEHSLRFCGGEDRVEESKRGGADSARRRQGTSVDVGHGGGRFRLQEATVERHHVPEGALRRGQKVGSTKGEPRDSRQTKGAAAAVERKRQGEGVPSHQRGT